VHFYYLVSPISYIFSDVCGRLEGESIVGEAIQDMSNLWYFEEPPQSPTGTPPPARSPNRDSPLPAPSSMTATPKSTVGVQVTDWREPIRRLFQKPNASDHINLRITDKPPSSAIPGDSPPSSSPIPPDGPSGVCSVCGTECHYMKWMQEEG